jgi:hypothetical protein
MGSGKRRPLTPCANVGFALMTLTLCMTEVGPGGDALATNEPAAVLERGTVRRLTDFGASRFVLTIMQAASS